jgi:hypothetical protein
MLLMAARGRQGLAVLLAQVPSYDALRKSMVKTASVRVLRKLGFDSSEVDLHLGAG